MKVKVGVSDLKIGMYVCELDRPWRDTPFLFQGFEIRSENDLRTLREHCREVYILDEYQVNSPGTNAWREWKNPASPSARRNAALQFEQELLKINNHPTARPVYTDETTLEREIELVRVPFMETRKMAEQVLDDVRLGRALDGVLIRKSVSQLTDSVLRNPDALTCYALLKRKDEYGALHSLRTCIMTLIFCRQLGMPREQIETMGMAALLHDIGMVRVPDEIVAKADRLNPVELSIMRRHVGWGIEMLGRFPGIPDAVTDAIREHHERFDGSGYPMGLKGADISEAGRIIGIVDYYDAVTSERVYQSAISPYTAMRTMYNSRGVLFDAELIERFIQCLGIYPVGSVVELNTGEIGVVVALNRTARLKPHVALVRQADRSFYSLPPVVNLGSRRMADGGSCEIERVLDPAEAGIDPVRYLPTSAAA